MKVIMILALVLTFVALVAGCTSSRVYVSTGDGAKAGKRQEYSVDSKIDSKIVSEVTGIKKNELRNNKSTGPKLH